MKKSLIVIVLAVGFMLTARAQIVQTLNLKNGSELHGYLKSESPDGKYAVFAEYAFVVMDGAKVKGIETKKVAFDDLSDDWKQYAKDNGLLDSKQGLNLSSIDTGNLINDVFVMEQGVVVKYVELKHVYPVSLSKIGSIDYQSRDKMLLSGINRIFKLNDGTSVTGQCIRRVPGETYSVLKEDGMVVSVAWDDIVKDNCLKNNPDQSLFAQSELLDEIKLNDGSVCVGIITERNYEQEPFYYIVTTEAGDLVSFRMDDIKEINHLPNPDYEEVRDVQLNKGQILVNGNDVEQVRLTEERCMFVIRPEMKSVRLKMDGPKMEIVVEANFKEEKETKDNHLIKTKKFTRDKKRSDLFFFGYKDIYKSRIDPIESSTSVNNTTKMIYPISSKGTYVLYNLASEKAIVIMVE